jgi:hypothetical protein
LISCDSAKRRVPAARPDHVLGHLPGLAPALERIENAFGPWNGASAPRVEEPAREAAVPAAAGLRPP